MSAPAESHPATGEIWFGHARGETGYTRLMIAMFAAGFATFLQVFDAQAVLPAISHELGVSASTASLTVSATTLGIAGSVLVWASVADRIGRVRAMKYSLVTATVLGLIAPLLPSFEAVVVFRGLTGVALGAVPGVAMAYLAEELHRDTVQLAAGTFVAGNTIGGITGRLIAGPLSEWADWRLALVLVAVIGAFSAAVFLTIAPPPRGFRPSPPQRGRVRRMILLQLRDPMMLGLYAQGFLLMGAFTAVYNYLGYRIGAEPLGVPASLISLLFLVYLSGTVSSRVAAGLARRIGHYRMITLGTAMMVVGALIMLPDALGSIVLGLAVFTVGTFAAHPLASGLTGQRAQDGRAQATALYQLFFLGGTSLFGWLVGMVFDAAGWSAVTVTVIAMCCGAALMAWLGLVALRERRPVV